MDSTQSTENVPTEPVTATTDAPTDVPIDTVTETDIVPTDAAAISMSDLGPFAPPIGPPVPEQPIALSDLMNDILVIQQTEATDRNRFLGLSSMNLRPKLVLWAAAGFPNCYVLEEILVQVPDKCSDGMSRDLPEYIVYLTNRTIAELVADLQTKVVDMTISFARVTGGITIVVSKTA
jgi:hypothetical protein